MMGSTLPRRPVVTVIVTNRDYGRYLSEAINSVRIQTYVRVELVVVDDGSTDESRDVLRELVDSAEAIFQPNGGQACALNAGVARARGDIICFLDADDWWRESKVEQVVSAVPFAIDAGAMVRHAVALCDGRRVLTDDSTVLRAGIHRCLKPRHVLTNRWHAPTSALAITRALADRVFPLPASGLRISADAAIYTLGRCFGVGITLSECLGFYRLHDTNGYLGAPDAETTRLKTEHELIKLCRARGWDPRIRAEVYERTRQMPQFDVSGILRRPRRTRVIDCLLTKTSLARRLWFAGRELGAWPG